MGIQRFTSVRTAPKFFGSNVRGIFLGGIGVGEVVVAAAGLVVSVGGFVVGAIGVGVAGLSAPVHPEARMHRMMPATIDLTTTS
jgi:hypothetical protein